VDQLREALAPAGEIVDLAIPADRMSGRPRGFAFVEFATQEQAAEAIKRFDGFELDGRRLRVNEATGERPARAGGFGRPDRSGPRPSRPKGSRRNARARKRSIW
jgi:RNA recognition motif-containing protein